MGKIIGKRQLPWNDHKLRLIKIKNKIEYRACYPGAILKVAG